MCGGWDIRNTPTYAKETVISANLMCHWPLGSYADFTSTSGLLFAFASL